MKKLLSILLSTMLLLSVASPVFAYRLGDVIGSTLKTDIVAKINGYDIASYNYQGNTYIIAEDLSDYGFNVSYNNSSRSLTITRDYGVSQIYATYKKPAVPKSEVGKKAFNILYTDIKTYIDGNYVTSYNINGQTIIPFDDLANYGDYVWNNSKRTLTLDMPGIAQKSFSSDDFLAAIQGNWLGEFDMYACAILQFDGNKVSPGFYLSEMFPKTITNVKQINDTTFEMTSYTPAGVWFEEYYPERYTTTILTSSDGFTREMTLTNEDGTQETYMFAGTTMEEVDALYWALRAPYMN